MLLILPVLLTLLLSQQANLPVHAFENRYRDLHTLRVRFLEQYSENGRIVRTEAGIAYFRKPGKMRWEYEKPERNLFLVDGKNAWFYTPADHTATKIPARQSEDLRTPLALLTEGGKLSKVCERAIPAKLPPIADGDLSPTSAIGLECIVKDDSSKSVPVADRAPASRILLEITTSGELARVVIQSAGSVQTEFRFKDWEYNPPLAEAQFHFSPPPGVVIVDGLLPSSPSVRQK